MALVKEPSFRVFALWSFGQLGPKVGGENAIHEVTMVTLNMRPEPAESYRCLETTRLELPCGFPLLEGVDDITLTG